MNLTLGEREIERLEVEAKAMGVSASALVRKACEHWLSRHSRTSGAATATEGGRVWVHMREANGAFVVEDSTGSLVSVGGRPYLMKRGTGSEGWRRCGHCGEWFDAKAGTYQWPGEPGPYVCDVCGEVLLTRWKEQREHSQSSR